MDTYWIWLLNPIQDGPFWGCSRMGGAKKGPPSLKSVTHPLMVKLGTVIPYLKKTPKIMRITWHTHWVLLTSAFSHLKSANFAIPRNIARYRLHFGTLFLILLIFFESLKIVLINMVTILMMSAKMATVGLIKIKVFWNKGYDVVISVHDVSSKIDTNYRCSHVTKVW